VSEVHKQFGGLRALDGAALRAEPGQVTALIGSNGAGKTTLLNAISGFIPPESGEITVDGEALTGRSAAKIARVGVSRAFQTPVIPEGMTVLEVVASGALRRGHLVSPATILRLPSFRRGRRADDRAARGLLQMAGLQHLTDQEAIAIPLGLRRLVEVLRAAMGSPRVIMLDEPAAGLGDTALADLGRLIDLMRTRGATVVLIEHNVPFVMSVADRVYAMDAGRLIAEGTPDEVRSSPEVISSYLGRSARAVGTIEEAVL
jgi:branched-chain amino acid transport system permease protein